jgi:RimJ/RimL family protein N-acetyltransferase
VRHDLRLDGQAFRLRPIELSDAPFVLWLRLDERSRGRLHPVSDRLEDQVRWLESYFERPGDWYWIVERMSDSQPHGTVGLYDLDEVAGSAEWGRWILVAGSAAAPESALLLYRVAFDDLGLNEVRCRTVANNAAVLSFHDRSGLERLGLEMGAFDLGGRSVDAVEHRLTHDRWPAVRRLLEARSTQVADFLSRSKT